MQTVTIQYKDAKGNITERDLSNIKKGWMSLQAFCHLRGEVKTFDRERIIWAKVKDTGEAVDFSLEAPKYSKIEFDGAMYDARELLAAFDPATPQGLIAILHNFNKMDGAFLTHLFLLARGYKSAGAKAIVAAIKAIMD
jgi:predicted DNA-binding transcriptional regulator YafY